MTNNDNVLRHLRSAFLPVDVSAPSRDLWPTIVQRSHSKVRLSPVDLGMAAVIAVVLLMFPKWFLLLAYHL